MCLTTSSPTLGMQENSAHQATILGSPLHVFPSHPQLTANEAQSCPTWTLYGTLSSGTCRRVLMEEKQDFQCEPSDGYDFVRSTA